MSNTANLLRDTTGDETSSGKPLYSAALERDAGKSTVRQRSRLRVVRDSCFDSPEIGEVRMTKSRSKPERAWREIAEEVSKEYDSDKVAELSEELIKALDKQSLTIRAVQTEKVRQKSA